MGVFGWERDRYVHWVGQGICPDGFGLLHHLPLIYYLDIRIAFVIHRLALLDFGLFFAILT